MPNMSCLLFTLFVSEGSNGNVLVREFFFSFSWKSNTKQTVVKDGSFSKTGRKL